MRELKIDKNEHDQRIDRFLKKYFSNANMSFIYKMLRKKRIKLNGKKANPEEVIYQDDKIQLYLSDETIDKFMKDEVDIKGNCKLNIVYEDENIILINKSKGILSHSTGEEKHEENIVDNMINYLYSKGEYNPRIEKTFTPSICNRLDRNTSGLILGAKNYNALKSINEAFRKGFIKRYYKCIVKGSINKDKSLKGYLNKNDDLNRVKVKNNKEEGYKEIKTDIKVLKSNNQYSLLEIDLITGRTHQIRAHLASIQHPIIGDLKYGDPKVNSIFKERFKLNNQYLHSYKLVFNGLEESMDYLNGKTFTCDIDEQLSKIEKDLF